MSPDLYPTRVSSKPSIIPRKDPVVYADPKTKGPLSKKELEFFDDNGYLLFPSLFSRKEIEIFQKEINELIKNEEIRKQPQTILEPESGEVRSLFEVHKNNLLFEKLASDSRVVEKVMQILNSDIHIHQSRVNLKPGFEGKEFFWHSDFETWHSEDGMPRMRAVSCSIGLTDNFEYNGPLMVMPGSHKLFISCVGKTPQNHYKQSLKCQEIGTPDKDMLQKLAENGIEVPKGPAGSAVLFDCNIMHGSNGNITPFPRNNVFFVFNSIKNKLVKPFCGLDPRPEYIASREFTPLRSSMPDYASLTS